jgi:dTDP-4-dehydrorhamnose reductase
MARKIMLTGACSQLGRIMEALLKVQDDTEVVSLRRGDLDILDDAAVMAAVAKIKPAVIINCAGFNDVAAAEKRLATKLPVNTRGVCNLAKAAKEFRVYLCTFSSKFVFDGKKEQPYIEDDDFWPINQYGSSKHGGEEMISNLLENYLIVRSDLLYGGGDDFVSRIQRELKAGNQVKVSDDFFIAPTYLGDLAAATLALVYEWAAGVYHYTNDAGNGINCYEFAQAVAELSDLDSSLLQAVPVLETEFGDPMAMPKRAILSIERFRELFPSLVRPWREALAAYLGR